MPGARIFTSKRFDRDAEDLDLDNESIVVAPKTYVSDALAAAHELAEDLYAAGLYDARTMREFDEQCLTEIHPMEPKEIRGLRDETGMSQAVLARVLNVTTSAVGQWERGEKKPTGSALKLLSLLRTKGLHAIL